MTPSHNHFPFARPHLSGVCAKAARLHPSSLGRAATLNHSKRQRSSGTALGLRWGMYRTTCAVGTTGRRFAGLGCHRRGFEFPAPRGYDLLTYLAGRFGVRSFSSALSLFDGIGRRANVPVANLIHRHQGRLQRFAKGQPRHLSAPVRYVPKPKDGAIGIDQNPIGASQNVNDC